MERTMITALAAAVMALQAGVSWAQSPDSFTVGGVVPLSGPYALLGTSMQKGAEIAIEERQKVLGVAFRALWEDSETKPQTSVQKATKLLAEGVEMLFGDGARPDPGDRWPRSTRSR